MRRAEGRARGPGSDARDGSWLGRWGKGGLCTAPNSLEGEGCQERDHRSIEYVEIGALPGIGQRGSGNEVPCGGIEEIGARNGICRSPNPKSPRSPQDTSFRVPRYTFRQYGCAARLAPNETPPLARPPHSLADLRPHPRDDRERSSDLRVVRQVRESRRAVVAGSVHRYRNP